MLRYFSRCLARSEGRGCVQRGTLLQQPPTENSASAPIRRQLAADAGVFPDYPAPVIRNTDTGRELAMMRWGMPPPPKTGGPPVTNIRNTSSPHWRMWLKPENRCLVPC
jgi:putative SOS response-associated peptidase YedK